MALVHFGRKEWFWLILTGKKLVCDQKKRFLVDFHLKTRFWLILAEKNSGRLRSAPQAGSSGRLRPAVGLRPDWSHQDRTPNLRRTRPNDMTRVALSTGGFSVNMSSLGSWPLIFWRHATGSNTHRQTPRHRPQRTRGPAGIQHPNSDVLVRRVPDAPAFQPQVTLSESCACCHYTTSNFRR